MIDPTIIALLLVLRQTSRATERESRSSAGFSMCFSVAAITRSETTLRNGDCPKLTGTACRRLPSKTGSAVELANSAIIILSRALSVCARREYKKIPEAVISPNNKTAAVMSEVHRLRLDVAVAPLPARDTGGCCEITTGPPDGASGCAP